MIAGRIVDEFGDAVSEAQVATLVPVDVNGERRLVGAPGRAVTNDVGEFRLFGLPPGDYFLSASFGNSTGHEVDDRSGYAPTYYPGTGNVQQAQRISIAPGQAISGLSMTVLPVRTLRISGVAIDTAGKPVAGGTVSAMSRVGMMTTGGQTARIELDGRFALSGLTPGDYVLRLNNQPGKPPSASATAITLNDSDITDLQLNEAALGTISGRVLFDDGRDVPKASNVRVSAQRPDPMLGVGGPSAGPVKDDFTFDFKVMPGTRSSAARSRRARGVSNASRETAKTSATLASTFRPAARFRISSSNSRTS